jgi:two-component system, LuxR family, sensor kinase FixL
MSANQELIGHNLERDPVLLQSLLSVSDLLVVVLDGDDTILLFNRACEKLSGYSAEEMIGRDVIEALVPEDERPGVHRASARLSHGDTEIPHTNHWLTRDGGKRLVEWNNTVLYDDQDRVRHVVATGVDITERERAREASERHKEQLLRLLDAFPALVAHIGADLRVRFANHGYRTWFDLEPHEQIGRHISDIIGAPAFDVLKPYIDQALSGNKAIYHGEVPYIGGGNRFIHGTYVPSFDDEGEIDGYYSLAVDLTEQEQLKNQLADQLRQSRTIVEKAMDAIITIDRRGIVNSFNPAAERIFGYRPEEVIGQNVAMLMPGDTASQHDAYLRDYQEERPKSVSVSGSEVVGMRKDGSPVELQLTVSAFTEGERYFVGFLHDISQRKRAEREAREHFSELARVTRLSALGEVTSGLAHEISQPLTAISAMAEASLMMLDKPRRSEHSIKQAIEQIARQGQRAREIIEQLRSFLRKDHPDRVEIYTARQLIENVLKLLTHELELAEVRTRIEVPEDMSELKINRVQIEQVLFNLIKNAVDAMRQVDMQRMLTIQCTRTDDLSCCEFSVSDTGPGISTDYAEAMFHPFFTTKTEGLGQGLSICRSIVENHGGTICGDNTPEGGAIFRFTIPYSLDE